MMGSLPPVSVYIWRSTCNTPIGSWINHGERCLKAAGSGRRATLAARLLFTLQEARDWPVGQHKQRKLPSNGQQLLWCSSAPTSVAIWKRGLPLRPPVCRKGGPMEARASAAKGMHTVPHTAPQLVSDGPWPSRQARSAPAGVSSWCRKAAAASSCSPCADSLHPMQRRAVQRRQLGSLPTHLPAHCLSCNGEMPSFLCGKTYSKAGSHTCAPPCPLGRLRWDPAA